MESHFFIILTPLKVAVVSAADTWNIPSVVDGQGRALGRRFNSGYSACHEGNPRTFFRKEPCRKCRVLFRC